MVKRRRELEIGRSGRTSGVLDASETDVYIPSVPTTLDAIRSPRPRRAAFRRMEIRYMRPSKTLLAALLVMVAALPVCAKKEKKPAAQSGAPSTSATAGGDEVVATIGGTPITRAEVDLTATAKLSKLRQDEYDVRRAAVEKLMQDKLYAKEAAARGVSVEDLVKAEIDSKLAEPSTEDIAKFYAENQQRMGGRTLEQVSGDIKNFLQGQKATARRHDYLVEVMAKNNAVILLDPPRVTVKVRDEDPAKGPKNAPVTIVEFSDFQCPFCKRAYTMVEEVVKSYGDKVRLVFRDYPLGFHPQAIPAAEAARCAGEQGKYWEYANHMMTVEGSLQDDDLKKRAGDVGLDIAKFTECTAGTVHEDSIKASVDEANTLGVTGTPTFFINGRIMVGAKPEEEIKAVIDEEIARATRKAAGGQQIGG